MEFLTHAEMMQRSNDLRVGLLTLLSDKALVGKPSARQWRFLTACLERMLEPEKGMPFRPVDKNQAAQWKFEVEDKLRRYYLRPGKPPAQVFRLVHRSQLGDLGIFEDEVVPDLAGYCLLVRDFTGGAQVPEGSPRELKAYLERVVAEAANAELRAYLALPELLIEGLLPYFIKGSPAYNGILTVLTQKKKKGWVLNNPYNPSTQRINKLSVRSIGQKEAIVHTTEYWYLRWWDDRNKRYTYPYCETNHQIYVLKCEDNEWKIYQEQKPSPRTSAPHRKAGIS